jgi:tryptophan 2,3-dioxygenase
MDLNPDVLDKLQLLEEKYVAMGQNMPAYLDGLLHADYLTYWDYIHLDTLLSLQNPRTPIPDERIFITYHQITELYFRLILDALDQLALHEPEHAFFTRQLSRINRYFLHLIDSFDIMVDGMDRDEFLKFRMSLLPASGFQSVQYRLIELGSTELINLVHGTQRAEQEQSGSVADCCNALYWRWGATELTTGKKTLTLRQFETKYADIVLRFAESRVDTNLYAVYKKLPEAAQNDPETKELMRDYDLNANVRWALSHYRSAVRYLDAKPREIEATGGTNWQQYLPPRFQKVHFFPELWSESEKENWGRFQ